jgi:taurine transport system substrate-binding protein
VSPQTVARAENWFSQEMDCNVEIVQFEDGVEISKAMKSGQIDFGMIGSVPVAKFLSQGMDCKVVCIQSIIGEIETLVVRSDSGINTAADLKGKTIATLYSSTAHYSLLKYLDVNGIDHKDVNVKHMLVADIEPAFKRGDIDGAFIWEPTLSDLMNDGGKKLVSAKEMADQGYATFDLEVVRSDFAKEYPDLVNQYVKCIDKAVKLYNDAPDKAGDMMAKVLKSNATDILGSVKSSTWLTAKEQSESEWFGGGKMADILYDSAFFLKEQGDIETLPDKQLFIDAVDSSFVDSFK